MFKGVINFVLKLPELGRQFFWSLLNTSHFQSGFRPFHSSKMVIPIEKTSNLNGLYSPMIHAGDL